MKFPYKTFKEKQRKKPHRTNKYNPSLPPSISYNFLTHKQSCVASLQNLCRKLQKLYNTCKYHKLCHQIYLMCVNIVKRLYMKNTKQFITSVEILASLSIAIKFMARDCQLILADIICMAGVNKTELIGAEIYVFQSLQFKLPVNYQFQQLLTNICLTWDTFISQQHPQLHQFLSINPNCPSKHIHLQNYNNLFTITDILYIHSQCLTYPLQQHFAYALYIMVLEIVISIDMNIGVETLLRKYWRYTNLQLEEKMNKWFRQVDVEPVLKVIKSMQGSRFINM